MNIDEIKTMMRTGDIAGAEAAAKSALENDPDNVRLLILFGSCRQLQGDEEARLGTYNLVRAALEAKKVELDATAAEEWKCFKALQQQIAQPELLCKGDPPRAANLMEYVMLAVIIAAATGVAIWYFGSSIQNGFTTANVDWKYHGKTTANVDWKYHGETTANVDWKYRGPTTANVDWKHADVIK